MPKPKKPTTAAEPTIGHNSVNSLDRDRLRSIIESIVMRENSRPHARSMG
jgi:hypothetical protein